ncbi:MAG: RNA 2',3'-cyclic phosphodiesterase [Gammaproteobacteria bacterium]|nr:RNA 2',3'-cyclic phosphodiesterase [Gammaproteobacteria bacterium]
MSATAESGRKGGKAGTRRLFFALWPDEPTRTAISEVAATAVPEAGGKPVPPDNYHITLRFLGNVDEKKMKSLRKAAELTFGMEQHIRLDRLGFWEGPGVVWLGCQKSQDDLLRLVVNLNTELGGVGFPHENRPFRPHVTLARKGEQEPTTPLARGLDWHSSEFVLVASTQDDKGSKYEVLERYPLRKPEK